MRAPVGARFTTTQFLVGCSHRFPFSSSGFTTNGSVLTGGGGCCAHAHINRSSHVSLIAQSLQRIVVYHFNQV